MTLTDANIAITRLLAEQFMRLSQQQTGQIADLTSVAAYFDRPRLVLVSARVTTDPATDKASVVFAIDLVRDTMHTVVAPGQATSAMMAFNSVHGLYDTIDERNTIAALYPAGSAPQINNTYDVFQAAAAAGIGQSLITQGTLGVLDSLAISADAKARITAAVDQGMEVIVPDADVTINGTPTTAWWQYDPTTGDLIGVTEDGGHQASGLRDRDRRRRPRVAGGCVPRSRDLSAAAGFLDGVILSIQYNTSGQTQQDKTNLLNAKKDAVTAAGNYGIITKADLRGGPL